MDRGAPKKKPPWSGYWFVNEDEREYRNWDESRKFGKAGFRLLYLWYDVSGDQGERHRDEVLRFTEVARCDRIKLHSLTYQELIVHLANILRTKHPEYIRYLTERYL
jgi:hypothetical protein